MTSPSTPLRAYGLDHRRVYSLSVGVGGMIAVYAGLSTLSTSTKPVPFSVVWRPVEPAFSLLSSLFGQRGSEGGFVDVDVDTGDNLKTRVGRPPFSLGSMATHPPKPASISSSKAASAASVLSRNRRSLCRLVLVKSANPCAPVHPRVPQRARCASLFPCLPAER
mgnify:FL=1